MKEELVPYFTFERIRGRTLVFCAVLTLIISSAIFSEINPISYKDITYQLPDGIFGILYYCVFILLISSLLFRSRLSFKNIFGKFPEWSTLARYSTLTIPLLLFSLCILYFQYKWFLALSPDFAEWFFEDNFVGFVYPSNVKLIIANILSILCIVIITPIFEEFFFRGILLTRWSIKWGIPKAIIYTSILFGILHTDVIGGIFSGYVMAIVYYKTKSLYVPICIHILNNFVAISIGLYAVLANHTSLVELNTIIGLSIWISLIGIFIVVAVMFNFIRKTIPNRNWNIPYIFHHNIENSTN